MEFEKAIEYRELLNSVTKIAQKQKITSSDMEDKDVIAMSVDQHDAVVQVFFIRDGRLIGRDHFCLRIANGDSRPEVLSAFIKQFYAGTPYIPREIMLQYEIEDAATHRRVVERQKRPEGAYPGTEERARRKSWWSWRKRMRIWCSCRIASASAEKKAAPSVP